MATEKVSGNPDPKDPHSNNTGIPYMPYPMVPKNIFFLKIAVIVITRVYPTIRIYR